MSAVSNKASEIATLSKLVDTLNEKGKGNCHRRTDVTNVFKRLADWVELPAGGHLVFKHKVTGVVVGCQGHGKEATIPRNQVKEIAEKVAHHLELLKEPPEEKNLDTKKRKR